MNDFLCHHPVEFNSKLTLDEVDDYICKLEKIFDAIECTEDQKLVFATYMLPYMMTGEAKYQWRGMGRGMDVRGEVATWVDFRNRFLESYFPTTAKHERERQFLALRQGNMSVHEYKKRFKYLARFYAQNLPEEWKCRRNQKNNFSRNKSQKKSYDRPQQDISGMLKNCPRFSDANKEKKTFSGTYQKPNNGGKLQAVDTSVAEPLPIDENNRFRLPRLH
ncbi:hypothetical protein V8G54_024843 [Vigna mungo]|uniref:Retrotransposon gag domain-containing protein n=1 Tax=Vigna mungo TaxID=3915 RepID=A0AAQ3RRP4_VIGMU